MSRRGHRLLLGAVFILAGINHFANARFYRAIMPSYLPWHAALVALSGVAEVGLGGLALLPGARRVARWGLVALLIAIFPANLYMAQHAGRYAALPAWVLWLRLPLQGLLIGWVWWATANPKVAQGESAGL